MNENGVTYRPRAVGAVFGFSDNTYLMQNRADGLLLFPGGKVEPGESSLDALKRECLEEIGVTINKASSIIKNWKDSQGYSVELFYIENWSGNFINKEPHKCLDFKYLTLNDLKNQTSEDLNKYAGFIENKKCVT